MNPLLLEPVKRTPIHMVSGRSWPLAWLKPWWRILVVPLAVLFLAPAQPTLAQTIPDGSLTLDEAVSRTLDGSREVREARLALEAAARDVAEARGGLLPRLDMNLRYGRNLTPPATFLPAILFDPDASPEEVTRVRFGLDNVWTGGLYLEQPLIEGRALAAVRAASRYQELQDEGVRGTVHQAVTETRLRYYDLLLAQERERLARESLDRVRGTLRLTRALREEGLASEYELLRMEVEVANLEPLLDRARTDRREADRELRVTMGLDPEGEPLRPEGSLSTLELEEADQNTPQNRALLAFSGVPTPEATTDELVRAALEGGSALREVELEQRVQEARIRAEQADRLPRISLFGAYDVQAQQDGSPEFFATSAQRGYSRVVGVQVTVPLFTGLQRRARVQRAQTNLRRVENQRDLLGDRTEAEVRTLVERTQEARGRARAQRRAMEQAERAYRIISALFGEGLASQMEVTDAEVALRQSEVNYAETVHGYLSARARLDVLIGRVPGVEL